MNIRTRLQIVAATSATLVVILASLFYWSQNRLASANKTKNLADEIVSSVFERKALSSDYLENGNQGAKDQWLSKQNHISFLLKKAPFHLISIRDRKNFTDIQNNIEGSSAVFQQILHNRDSARNGTRDRSKANENENRLAGQLLAKFLDTIADAH